MRVIIFFLSLVFMLQPASWAHDINSPIAKQMTSAGEFTLSRDAQLLLDPFQQCQVNKRMSPQSMLEMQVLAGNAISQQHEPTCMAQCLGASSANMNLNSTIGFNFTPQYAGFIYPQGAVSYYSHTESPEIRPPLSIHS